MILFFENTLIRIDVHKIRNLPLRYADEVPHIYIGKGFDSFDDCLYELRKGNVIINIRKIKEVEPFLIRISPPGINYKEIFEDVLRENNCNIID